MLTHFIFPVLNSVTVWGSVARLFSSRFRQSSKFSFFQGLYPVWLMLKFQCFYRMPDIHCRRWKSKISGCLEDVMFHLSCGDNNTTRNDFSVFLTCHWSSRTFLTAFSISNCLIHALVTASWYAHCLRTSVICIPMSVPVSSILQRIIGYQLFLVTYWVRYIFRFCSNLYVYINIRTEKLWSLIKNIYILVNVCIG